MNLKNKVYAGILSAALMSGAVLWEGNSPKPYEDIVGVLTVCHGHTGKDIVKNKIYTKDECTTILKRDLGIHQKAVLECVTRPIEQNPLDAFTLFTLNVGGKAFCNSTLVKKFNAGDTVGACNELLRWNYAGGKYVQGLNNRRKFENKLCLGQTNG